MEIQTWLLFTSIALIATITPGPAILLVSSHSLSYGLKPSLVTILGNISGLLILSTLSVLGLSAVILHSLVLFTFVKIFGASYLIYLGIKLWRKGFIRIGSSALTSAHSKIIPNFKRRYFQGILISLSNPKAIIFTTALFPQFIDPGLSLLFQFSILVITFMFLSSCCLFGYAFLAVRAQNKFMDSKFSHLLGRVFGFAFIGAGFALLSINQKA